jgi:hypothetical protein
MADAYMGSLVVDEKSINAWQSSRPTPCQLVGLQAGKMLLVCDVEWGSMLILRDDGREHERPDAQSRGW